MRTGAEYRDALRDGRRVRVLGDGQIEDVTSHPTTCAPDESAGRYDRHFDPEWRDIVPTPPGERADRLP
jgi:4-hydroxyphenylacetate 3-monooxygenase